MCLGIGEKLDHLGPDRLEILGCLHGIWNRIGGLERTYNWRCHTSYVGRRAPEI
jgi:hypothetical protein